MSSSKTQMR